MVLCTQLHCSATQLLVAADLIATGGCAVQLVTPVTVPLLDAMTPTTVSCSLLQLEDEDGHNWRAGAVRIGTLDKNHVRETYNTRIRPLLR